MIIVKLMGGLGNQMFQYAAGKALAMRHGTDLRLDTTFLEAETAGAYTKRKLELSVFSMRVTIAGAGDLSFYQLPVTRWHRFLRSAFSFMYRRVYFVERGQVYQEEFNRLPADTYLEGFWQNQKYFAGIREQLLLDFRVKEPLPSEVAAYVSMLDTKNFISVHVRRGDYISNPGALEFHGLPGTDYYRNALAIVTEKAGRMGLMVFSDDMDWCRKNISHQDEIIFVEHAQHAVWDLWLMSRCSHNIIANSSFSWWAGWLNTNPSKIVVMPGQWFSKASSVSVGVHVPGWIIV